MTTNSFVLDTGISNIKNLDPKIREKMEKNAMKIRFAFYTPFEISYNEGNYLVTLIFIKEENNIKIIENLKPSDSIDLKEFTFYISIEEFDLFYAKKINWSNFCPFKCNKKSTKLQKKRISWERTALIKGF